jgi:hypothetical protein
MEAENYVQLANLFSSFYQLNSFITSLTFSIIRNANNNNINNNINFGYLSFVLFLFKFNTNFGTSQDTKSCPNQEGLSSF